MWKRGAGLCRDAPGGRAAVLGAPQPSGSTVGSVVWLCLFKRQDSEISSVGLIPEMWEKGGEQQISLGLVPAKFSSGPLVRTCAGAGVLLSSMGRGFLAFLPLAPSSGMKIRLDLSSCPA